MSVPGLIERLAAEGVELWFEGERLRFRSPKGALTAALRQELSARKAEVLAHLRAEAAQATTTCELSFSQRSLWFLNRQSPESAAYNVGFAARVVSTINPVALGYALQSLVDRHATLRTAYPLVDDVPVQRVVGYAPVELDLIDAAGLGEDELQRRVAADYARPFDLDVGRVFRAALYTSTPTDHVLLIAVHHIAADGWSILQLIDELRDLYVEADGGAPAPLARPETRYVDYTRWQRQMLDGDEGRRLAEYWSRQLAAPRAEIELPADRRRPALRSSHGATSAFQLDPATSQGLRALARAENATLFVVLLATFKTLLYRHTGTEDVIVGTPTFGRNRPEFAKVIGDFVNTIAVRSRLSADETFSALVAVVRQTMFEALDTQDYPFPLLVEQLQPVRNPSRSPLFETLFVMQRFDQLRELDPVLVPGEAGVSIQYGGLRLANYPLYQQEGQFDLTLQVVDRSGALALQFKYNPDLFDGATIDALARRFQTLAAAIVADPRQRLSALALSPAEERRQLIARAERVVSPTDDDWTLNATVEPFDEATVIERFERQVAETPTAIAVGFEGEVVTYAELSSRVNRLARQLREVGVTRGVTVGVCVERSLNLVVGLLAIQKAGGAYLPLDPGFPSERLSFMLADSGAAVLIAAGTSARGLDIAAHVRVVDVDREAAIPQRLSDHALDRSVRPDDLAYLIYTSGSTGRPKGVAVSHRALSNFLCSMQREPGMHRTDVLAAVTTISFDIAGLEIYLPLICGARIELLARQTATDGRALAQHLTDCGVTILQATPATWRLLVEVGWRASRPFRALCGGEALPPDLAETLVSRVDELWNLYGPTETTIWSTVDRVRFGDTITVGRPIANTQIYVVDQRGEPLPVGVVGEIWIGGDGVANGYHNRPELTDTRFIADPFSNRPGARVYRTGDIGRWRSDGRLEHLGRLDHQVKIRGFRIELGEIETVLARHVGVREAVVVARADANGEQRLVAYVVAAAAPPSVSELREYLASSLSDYMVPATFVFLDKIPQTQNGKIDRNALPAPGDADIATGEDYVPPGTNTEQIVAQVFAEVLAVTAVGLHHNFFQLGGHSLLVTRALSQLRRHFAIDIPLTVLFDRPTPQALSRWIDGARDTAASAQPTAASEVMASRWKCLVPAPSGDASRPVFLITGYLDADDTMRILSNFIAYLGQDRALCGLRPRWLDGTSPPYTSVAEMADEYLSEVRMFQPNGPYYLVGDCVGGIVAVEMAQHLREQGHEVALLALLDTVRPSATNFILSELTRVGDRTSHIASLVRQIVWPKETTRRQVIRGILERKFHRAGDRPTAAVTIDDGYQQRTAYQRLLQRHRLRPYPGKINLFVCDELHKYLRLFGWDGFAAGGVEVIRTPGDHLTFRAQYCRELVQRFRVCLERADAEREPHASSDELPAKAVAGRAFSNTLTGKNTAPALTARPDV